MEEDRKKTEISPELLKQVVNTFMLGADPEFVVLNPSPGRLVDTEEQIVNAHPYRVAWGGPAGAIGDDHGGRVWEVRPSPSPSSYGVLLNIWRLLKSAPMAVVDRFKWKSGALGGQDTLGGHIHYGLPTLAEQVRQCLADCTIGLEKLDILPESECLERRRRGNYGRLSDVRDSSGHVEYRAPASWLGSPSQAFATLTTFKLAAADPDCAWFEGKDIKLNFLNWVQHMSLKDVDAFLLMELVRRRGFDSLQADPKEDFKPKWRKEDLWAK